MSLFLLCSTLPDELRATAKPARGKGVRSTGAQSGAPLAARLAPAVALLFRVGTIRSEGAVGSARQRVL